VAGSLWSLCLGTGVFGQREDHTPVFKAQSLKRAMRSGEEGRDSIRTERRPGNSPGERGVCPQQSLLSRRKRGRRSHRQVRAAPAVHPIRSAAFLFLSNLFALLYF
jgi:hypothetical protein